MNGTAKNIADYLGTPIMRLLTCGSVDDGKSTFIGRLLLDSGNVYEDHLSALQQLNRKTGNEPELAYLVDGLKAEIEQGITIDVSYRYFFTRKRKFIIADAPGHTQYTRNMAVAASKSDLAVLLVDVSSGIKPQTKRHLSILSLMGVDRLIVAVNKIDLVDFKQDSFEETRREIASVIETMYGGRCSSWFVPVSSKLGDNVVSRSETMTWYDGGSVLELLETIDVEKPRGSRFCLPVQYVSRDSERRHYAGTVISGSISVGDEIVAVPSLMKTRVVGITVSGNTARSADTYEPVMIELADDIDIARGDKLVASGTKMMNGDTLFCQVFWFGEEKMEANSVYELKFLSRKIRASVKQVKERLDLDTLKLVPSAGLARNEIGLAAISLSATHYCLPFKESGELGSFLIVDIGTAATVGLGTIVSVEKEGHPYPYATIVDKTMRASLKNQHPMLIWLTGLSGAGKSTIANLLEQRLYDQGYHTYLLDGDILRNGLNNDLSFDPASRKENIRRAGEVARLMVEAGLIVIASFISPYAEDRALVRNLFESGEYCEVYVSTPLEECVRRDPKGLYAKALRGEIPDFTGISSPYEPPASAEITIDASSCTVQEAVGIILNHLAED